MWNVRMWGKARKGGGRGGWDKEINEIPTEAQRAVSGPATKVLSGDNVPVVVTALSVLPTRPFNSHPT